MCKTGTNMLVFSSTIGAGTGTSSWHIHHLSRRRLISWTSNAAKRPQNNHADWTCLVADLNMVVAFLHLIHYYWWTWDEASKLDPQVHRQGTCSISKILHNKISDLDAVAESATVFMCRSRKKKRRNKVNSYLWTAGLHTYSCNLCTKSIILCLEMQICKNMSRKNKLQ